MPTIPGYTSNPGPALPADAPRIRATAGAGTAGQKTWSLRRPVTVVGSGRAATIVVNHPGVDKAHCAIINTGECVVVKDLHSASGTTRNGQRIDAAVVSDGDVIQVADVRIQIAIQSPRKRNEETGAGMSFSDPMRWAGPVVLHDRDGRDSLTIDRPFHVIGRREGAFVRLHEPEVSLAHAIVFEFDGRPAICDLASRTGIAVNKKRVAFARLTDGDQITVGPATWRVEDRTRAASSPSDPGNGADDLDHRKAELEEWERRLKARETALTIREGELRRVEDALRRREQLLRAKEAQTASGTGDAPTKVRFTGQVGSSQDRPRIAVPPPPRRGS